MRIVESATPSYAQTFVQTLDEARNDRPVLLKDLPELVEPIADFIHEHKPQRVVAADRGARLGGLALRWLYRAKYNESLPVNFLCVSKTTPDHEFVLASMFALRLSLEEREDCPEVLFFDDWVDTGKTVSMFYEAATQAGAPPERLCVATLCGKSILSLPHVVGDGSNFTLNSAWNAYEEMMGFVADPEAPFRLQATFTRDALIAREKLRALVKEHVEAKA